MNNPSKSGRRSGAPESPASKETFAKRAKPPGKAGLANEVRPGLGTRGETAARRPASAGETPHDADPMGRNAPMPPAKPAPAPREQDSDSLAQRKQRDTGASGHMGAD